MDFEGLQEDKPGHHPGQQKQVSPTNGLAEDGHGSGEWDGSPGDHSQWEAQTPDGRLLYLIDECWSVDVLDRERPQTSIACHPSLRRKVSGKGTKIQNGVGRGDEEHSSRDSGS